MINEKMRMLGAKRSVIRELFEYGKKRKSEIGDENVFDFSLGNPSTPAPVEVTENLIKLISETEATKLHGYTSAQGDFLTRCAVKEYIENKYGEKVDENLIYMTVGAAGALTSVLGAVLNDGEEVIVLCPYFPEYKVFIERAGGKVREVMCDTDTFMPSLHNIEEAINENTAAIIINSPNNPTGVLYTEEIIKSLADMLNKKEKELGHPVYLISDEPYRELVYDGKTAPFLTKYYANTIVTYSFSKSLSLPGERIGYALVCPRATDAEALYEAICGSARALGFVCAPSLLQKLLPSVMGLTADISVYDENRRILKDALTEYGFDVVNPDGAFYLFLKSPLESAEEFCEAAKKHELLIVPSDDFGIGGYARISYCVDTDLIRRALPAFRALANDVIK